MIGKTVSHYKILEKLGEGGMGVVYRAEDTKLKRDVAIKFLPQKLSAEGEELDRFKLEAQAAAALNHPNIATIHEIDNIDNEHFIVMEMVKGQTLQEIIAKGPLDIAKALEIANQIVDGLQEAHENEIVHRDIKPANIMLTPKGQIKIMDFGLAKMSHATLITKAGTTLGTAAYMSPEQAHGQIADHRTDIWSFGVLLYEMISGQRPFQGDYEQAMIYAITSEDAPPVTGLRSGVPMELERIINKAMAKSRDERYQHADEMRADLLALQKADASGLSKTQSAVGAGLKPAPTRTRFLLGGFTVVILLTIAAVFYFRDGEEQGIVAIERKMLVVLPFENLGPPEDQYFADGLTEELTSRLALVHGLGVISRTSAVQYKNSNKTSKQIKEELGVDYILEGTLRWDKNTQGISRVRVTPQLIRTTDDTHVWAEAYDRVLDQIFEVQSEIAEQVVKQLDITLLEPERQAVWKKPTRNLEAYDYYLLGFKHNDRGWASSDEKEFELALEMFQKAIDLDPNFAHAHLMLSGINSWIYFTGFDHSDARLKRARDAIDRAEQLQPDLPDIQREKAWYHYRQRDYESALQANKKYRKAVPSGSPWLEGLVFRRQGKWEPALAAMKEEAALNPRRTDVLFNLGALYTGLRNYQEADKWYDRALSLQPGYADPTLYKYRSHLLWKGNAQNLRASLKSLQRNNEVNYSLHFINLFEGRFQEALAHVDSLADFTWRGGTLYLPKDLAYAQIYGLMGETAKSEKHAELVRPFLEQKVQEQPSDHRRHMALGLTYSFLGRKKEAMREGEKAVELFPVSIDALWGPRHVGDLAWIYTNVGEQEAAIEQLAYLLSIQSQFSAPLLRIDPRWDSLRDHPRYQKLVVQETNSK